jgi:hypothetical protein
LFPAQNSTTVSSILLLATHTRLTLPRAIKRVCVIALVHAIQSIQIVNQRILKLCNIASSPVERDLHRHALAIQTIVTPDTSPRPVLRNRAHYAVESGEGGTRLGNVHDAVICGGPSYGGVGDVAETV